MANNPLWIPYGPLWTPLWTPYGPPYRRLSYGCPSLPRPSPTTRTKKCVCPYMCVVVYVCVSVSVCLGFAWLFFYVCDYVFIVRKWVIVAMLAFCVWREGERKKERE